MMTNKQTSAGTGPFEARLAKNLDELKWLYCELYHNDAEAFDRFLEMLRRSYDQRKAASGPRTRPASRTPPGTAPGISWG